MSPSPQLAPPGSSSYSSNTLHVGDGTWDTQKNTFLLPNLVGLNFATMRYNGMGNRFFTMTGYHGLVKAHGVLAAITFLGLVPAAIMLARFRWALRLHIWLQILTFILTTALFILGFFAVGPQRSLSNPHHGIGVALYVLIIVQVFGGWWIHRKGKGKRQLYVSLKLVLHQWLGRTVALLGIAQVSLGLTLYGSPEYLFILYAMVTFVLLLTYFILSWRRQRRLGRDFDDYTEEGTEDSKSGLGKMAAIGLGAAGLAALGRRGSSKRRRDDEAVAGTESGASYLTNEKYSDRSRSGWKSKLLKIGVVAGAIAAVQALFGSRRDESSDAGPYRPPPKDNQSLISESYIEEGRPPRPITPTGASPGYIRPSHPLAQPPMTPHHRRSNSSLGYSYSSGSPSRRDRRHDFRTAAATGGALFALRQLFKSRRQRKEDRRVEEERYHRANSLHQYTGDGFSPKRHRRRMGTQPSTEFSESVIDDRPPRTGGNGSGPILGGVGAASAAALADRNRIRPPGTDPPVIAGPSTMAANIPPVPPTHGTEMDSSVSDVHTAAPSHPHRRNHRQDQAPVGMAASAAGAAAGSRRRHSGRTQNTDSIESPPVSLKVKMHNDGRHVTLRRLTEEEAAAHREERRRAKRASVPAPAAATAGGGAGIANSGRRRRNSSFSSSSGGEGGAGRMSSADRRWRRTEALERQQAEAMAAQSSASQQQQQQQQPPPPPPPPGPQQPAAPPPPPSYAFQQPMPPPPPPTQGTTTTFNQPHPGQQFNLPPPPPIPNTNSGLGHPGSVTSPGTETSGATEYANNRRRRRAERAQARLARDGRLGAGQNVEFS